MEVTRQPGEIHVGSDPLLFVATLDYQRQLRLHWVSGSLAEWLTFVFCKYCFRALGAIL